MHHADRHTEAAALAAFFASDLSQWSRLAPLLLAHVSQDRLRTIVDATRHRVGEPLTVGDSTEGLVIAGPRGRVCAWVSLDDDRINDLLISPHLSSGRPRPPEQPQHWNQFLQPLVWPLVLAAFAGLTWTAADRGSWIAQMLLVVAGYLGFEGFGAPALYPWWYRRPLEALSLIAICSAVLWPDLPAGGIGWAALGGAVAVLVAVLLLRDQRYRWGASPAQPLERLPVAGRWYVVQGGGRRLNHHVTVPNQRGAIDVVRIGVSGSRIGSTALWKSWGKLGGSQELTDYLAYGQDVVAPCPGIVRSVMDGLLDQVPGVIRFGPAAGNHVVIDTGSELVLLAHLRSGTVRVAPGETVRTGELLGQVGNSGNTTEPHLHLHLERAGEGLDLDIRGLRGVLHRGRTIRG